MIDLDKLCEPISEENPAGEDLRLVDGGRTLVEIQEARREAEPDDFTGDEGKDPDFPQVANLAGEALATRTKDLELAVLLTEASARLEGLSALRDGLLLMHHYVEQWWDWLHPGIDPDDGEVFVPLRRKCLDVIGGNGPTALNALLAIPVFWLDAKRSLTWGERREAERMDMLAIEAPQQHAEMLEADAMTGDRWQSELGQVPQENLAESLQLAKACQEALGKLIETCNDRFGDEETPGFAPLAEILEEVVAHATPLIAGEEALVIGEDGVAMAAAGPAGVAGPIQTRAQALQRLSEVADFFRRTEPHSPISHLVQRSVRWGNMSLEDLLTEMVKDEGVLGQIWDTLGISPAQGEEDEY